VNDAVSRIVELPVPLVCPLCRRGLAVEQACCRCPPCENPACPREFPHSNGFPDLILGERFPDEDLPERMAYEEESNEYSTLNYWIPLFRSLWPAPAAPKLLAMGCGVGTEVDLLNDAGFSCTGIDSGNRSNFWRRRRYPHMLSMANGLYLPFADNTFDGVFCGCVFAHVGVEGDSSILKPGGLEERQRLASEMARVTKPGGAIVVASPNRWFPFDLFHGREDGSYKVKFNPPGDRFLLSAGDFREMFVKQAGCQSLELMPVQGFWGFIRANHTFKGRLLSLPIKAVFRLLAYDAFSWLRSSSLTPWITVCVRK